MPKRSLLQIQEGLRKKLAEADPLDPLGDIGRTSPHRGDPVISPDLGGGQGPGGAGGGGARVWRVPGKPTSQTSPRPSQTPQEKLIAQAQQRAKQTGEPTIAVTEPKVARILDKLFPEPKTTAKVEPTLRPPSKEAERQEKLQQLRQREAERQQQKQAAQQPQPAPAPVPAEKPLSKQDQKNLDKYGTTDQEKIANIKKLDAERRKVEKETPILGPYGRAAVKTGTAGALGYGAYQLFKPDEQKPEEEKPADTDTKTDQTVDRPPAVAVDKTPPDPPKPDARSQSVSPQDTDSAAQDTEPQKVEPIQAPPPGKPYPPGTKFSPDEILETYNRVLTRYRNFLYEETDEERKQAEKLKAIQRSIYGIESEYGKTKTDRPNYAGARGPMQIMPGTFQWMKEKNIIPKDFDIKNPEQNKQAGNALIQHYYQKYQGDPAKVYAAYYAGPGAINKDGTINTHWRDRKNPKAPNVGQYIDSGIKKAGLTDVQYVALKPSTTTQTKIAGRPAATPAIEPEKADKPVTVSQADTRAQPTADTITPAELKIDTPVAQADTKTFDPKKFDYDAFFRAVDRGEDWSDFSKYTKTSSSSTKPSVSERYENFKAVTR